MTEIVSVDDVTAAMVTLGVPLGTPVAVGLSGGADSLALALLASDAFQVTCLTVDHGLREASSREAVQAGTLCNEFGIKHCTLVWQGSKPSSNIQAYARDARYDLMVNWCIENSVAFLATAHHRDDQAETVLLRLARGSGVYGLAGMAPTRDLGGVTLVRPLLTFPKKALRAYLVGRACEWIEDPSNKNEDFDRVKIRKLLADPPVEGLRSDRLAATARRFQRSRAALEHYEALWLGRAAESFAEGYAYLNAGLLDSEPEEIILRGLASLCRYVSGGDYVPRMEKLQRLFSEISADGFRGQTLYGAQFTPVANGLILISREVAAVQPRTLLKETNTWDNRFEISAKGDMAGREIDALGEAGWQQLKVLTETRDLLVPRQAVLSLPAVFKGTKVQSVPHLAYNADDSLTVCVGQKRKLVTKK